jgi:hypothetical protein
MSEQVRNAEPSLCKAQPDTFKVMREMPHSSLSIETLESYLDDLHKANPTIHDIVEIEARWMKELSEEYRHTVKGGLGLKIYLSSGLETYSDKTLKLYFKDISKGEKGGRNLVEEQYTLLFQQIGYSSIAEVEKKTRA